MEPGNGFCARSCVCQTIPFLLEAHIHTSADHILFYLKGRALAFGDRTTRSGRGEVTQIKRGASDIIAAEQVKTNVPEAARRTCGQMEVMQRKCDAINQ